MKYLEEKKQLPRPDFRITIDTKPAWGEYDTGSEGLEQKIIPKMKLYIKWMVLLKDTSPILWVTDTENRCKLLQGAWDRCQNDEIYDELKQSEDFYFPKMVFVTLDEVSRLVGGTKLHSKAKENDQV